MFSAFLQLPQTTMTTTELSPGIYRIAVAKLDGVVPELLTRHGKDGVTILPPSVQPDPEQQVICCFLTSSIVYRSPALLVGNHPWSRAGQHRHHAPLQVQTKLLPYLQR